MVRVTQLLLLIVQMMTTDMGSMGWRRRKEAGDNIITSNYWNVDLNINTVGQGIHISSVPSSPTNNNNSGNSEGPLQSGGNEPPSGGG